MEGEVDAIGVGDGLFEYENGLGDEGRGGKCVGDCGGEVGE